MDNDWELLAAYAVRRDEAAFRELVRRHVDVVYGAARRMLGGPGQEAEDVTQAVFLLLARKAGGIRREGALVGWLFRVTRYCCANVRKSEGRRRRREKEVAVRDAAIERLQEDLRPVLDEGLAGLSEKERQAILVRYLEGKTARETGEMLGISEAAVEKRVERGVAKLRGYFAKCGYLVPVGAAVAVLSGEVHAAPAGLAGSIGSGAGVSGKAAAIAKGAAAMMAWGKVLSAGIVAAFVAVIAAGGVVLVEREMPHVTVPVAARIVSVNTAATDDVNNSDAMIRLIRWDAFVTKEGADRLRQGMEALPSVSVGYDVYRGDAERLRQAMITGQQQRRGAVDASAIDAFSAQ